MVTKNAAAKKPNVSKLKLKKDTIKDLNVKGIAASVKGGMIPASKVACPTVVKYACNITDL